MKIFTSGVSDKRKAYMILAVFGMLIVALTVISAFFQKGRAYGGGGETESGYLYDLLASGVVYASASGVEQSFWPESGPDADAAPDSSAGCNVLVLGKDYDSNRTDAIICVSFDFKNGAVSTLQIPRDTYVKDGDYAGRINTLLPRYRAAAAEAGSKTPLTDGITRLMAKIEADFGIKCDNFIFLDSAAVERLTDAMGGVTVDVPADIDYTDGARGLDLHLKEGRQHMDGKTASQFVRYRQGYLQADLGRINAQKLYAAAMLGKLASFSSVTTAAGLVNTLASCVTTDLTAEDIGYLVTKLCLADSASVVMYTMPGDGAEVNGASYYGVNKDKYYEILIKAFTHGFPPVAASLTVQDFPGKGGGFTDTDGVKLSSILDHGIGIPVYVGNR